MSSRVARTCSTSSAPFKLCHRTAEILQAEAYVLGFKGFFFILFRYDSLRSLNSLSLSLSLSLSAVSKRVCVFERELFFNICFVYSHSTYRPQTLMNFIMVKINLDHLNEWVIFIWIALTPIFKLGRPAQRPLRWSLHRLAFSMWVKQSDITSHLWVLRPRSTIKLSPTIRSVATETQWSRLIKLRYYEFLLSRMTETHSR